MKIAILSPYFDTYGGGERYLLTIADELTKKHSISIYSTEDNFLENARNRFNLNLININVIKLDFYKENLINRLKITNSYDLIFYLSDGSIPFSLSRFNILHIQSPINRSKLNFYEKLKLKKFNNIIVNSKYTKGYIDKAFFTDAEVIYPPVQKIRFDQNLIKKNHIISISRFSNDGILKGHEALIDSFKILSEKAKGFKLILLGSLRKEDTNYLHNLKKISNGYDIEFYENINHKDLFQKVSEAKFFWHAAGFSEEALTPDRYEHFGISLLEAMGMGCFVFAYNGGGPKEIINDGINGYLWNSKEELIRKTIYAIDNYSKLSKITKNSLYTTNKYSEDNFRTQINNLVDKLK